MLKHSKKRFLWNSYGNFVGVVLIILIFALIIAQLLMPNLRNDPVHFTPKIRDSFIATQLFLNNELLFIDIGQGYVAYYTSETGLKLLTVSKSEKDMSNSNFTKITLPALVDFQIFPIDSALLVGQFLSLMFVNGQGEINNSTNLWLTQRYAQITDIQQNGSNLYSAVIMDNFGNMCISEFSLDVEGSINIQQQYIFDHIDDVYFLGKVNYDSFGCYTLLACMKQDGFEIHRARLDFTAKTIVDDLVVADQLHFYQYWEEYEQYHFELTLRGELPYLSLFSVEDIGSFGQFIVFEDEYIIVPEFRDEELYLSRFEIDSAGSYIESRHIIKIESNSENLLWLNDILEITKVD